MATRVKRTAGLVIPPPLEKNEQTEITKLLRLIGAKVYWLSQARHTQQTPGVPDLFAFVKVGGEIVPLWIEAKRNHRKAAERPEQIVFRLLCKLAGAEHIVGTLEDVQCWLSHKGLIRLSETGQVHVGSGAGPNAVVSALEAFVPLALTAAQEAMRRREKKKGGSLRSAGTRRLARGYKPR
ncbi:MAG: hypothetical protein ACK5VI_10715 [Opitutia bacterium]|jgi:hypothetical protein